MKPSGLDREPVAPLRTDGGRVDDSSAQGVSRIGAALLAAGTGTRFEGGNKLLATLNGDPVVHHAASSLVESSIADIVAVTGYEADSITAALESFPVDIVHNPDYADGQSTSVARAVAVARDRDWDATVFALGDMPAVEPTTIDTLRSAYETGEGTILPAAYRGQRGNPVLFDSSHYGALASVSGDRGGRELLAHGEGVSLVETDDPGVIRDIDRSEDLDALE